MKAGAGHAVPLWRHRSTLVVVLAVTLGWAVVPAVAEAGAAAAAVGTATSTVAAVEAPPVQEATEAVAGALRPAVGGVTAPAPYAAGGPVEQAVAPVAHGAGATVPPAAATASQTRLNEGATARGARIAHASSVERPRARTLQSPHGVARQRPSNERTVSLPGAAPTGAVSAPDAAATPSRPPPEPGSGFPTGAPGADATTGFLFGGALALLVAALLLAGPRLRRRLALLRAVCRPAAFLVVLERPG
jgi:hypothetical protein